MPRLPAGLIALALLAALPSAGCRRRAPAPPPAAPSPPPPGAPADPMPAFYPATLDPARYTGAAGCRDCHAKQFDQWQRSPHGRAMAAAGPGSVLGDFHGQAVSFADGAIEFAREGDAFFMATGGARHRVELTIGAGRQHQLYVTKDADGTLRLLPAYWATRTREWVLTTVQLGTALDPQSPRHWLRADVVSRGNCFHCHLSQGRSRVAAGAVETTWVDLPIDCEACHGPGRAHAEARRAGRADAYRDLKLLSKEEEATICARCHAGQRLVWNAARPEGQDQGILATLASRIFRPDGTQFGTPYQYAGHVSSACYRKGALTCSACHDPHRQSARSLAGEPAEGARSDAQCAVCHRDLATAAAAAAHGHHAKPLRCVDCHMPLHWLTDSPASRQRVADHAIPIPRPQETIEFRVPNACNECHADKDPAWALGALRRWGQGKALGVRPWVRAFALGRAGQPGAVESLVAVLQDAESPPLWRASALELLLAVPPDPALVPIVAPFAADRDPTLRAWALHALINHDAARRESWIMGAFADEDPLVRSILLDLPIPLPVPDDQARAFLIDQARYLGQPPGESFARVARAAAAAGMPARARMVLDLALPHATAAQIEAAGMRELRASLPP